MKPEVVEFPTPERAKQTAAVNARSPACECGAADRRMLEGPRSRTSEVVQLLRVMSDFLRGFRVLHFVGRCVTVFGSARMRQDDLNYHLAREVGAALPRLGFTVMTGGGPAYDRRDRSSRPEQRDRKTPISMTTTKKET